MEDLNWMAKIQKIFFIKKISENNYLLLYVLLLRIFLLKIIYSYLLLCQSLNSSL